MQAELVFTGGPVHLGNAARSRTDAVAVTGERIVALGADARELIGTDTDVVDLRGRLLIPGFQDAHVHPVGGGVELGQCNLAETVDPEEYRRRITAYAEANPGAAWILGGGWSMEAFPGGMPEARVLDELVGDRPAYLMNRDHHGAWVNSRALELAGIDAGTPDPADGRIERYPDGSPTGMLQEGAMNLVARLAPRPTEEDLLQGLLRAQALLHSFGITAWQDALVGDSALMENVTPAYRLAGERGLLTARVVGSLWWQRNRGAEQIRELIEKRAELGSFSPRFRATTVKIMQDGVAENHTAAMLSPYLREGLGCACTAGGNHDGISFVDPEALKSHVTALDREGFQVHFHALGDRAVREALDAIEAAQEANGSNDNRHHLAHLQVVHPDDVARFRRLRATANMQPLWASHEPQMDELTIPYLGAERASWQYPFGSLRGAGATLAAGSDWPVSSANPVLGIHTAVNRIEPDEEHPVFYPEERLDLGTALTAYTAGTAWVNHLDQTGTIAIGNLADLAVLDRDPFESAPAEIWETTVEQTFVGGERVFAR